VNAILTESQSHKRKHAGKIGSAQELASLLSDLDPLSLNVSAALHAKEFDGKSLAAIVNSSNIDDDSENNPFADEDDALFLDTEDSHAAAAYRADVEQGRQFNISNISEYPGSDANKYIIRKKQRIRAEKLVDHEFTRNLFTKKATIADTQSLIRRMEGVLLAMDTESTGFVTWEQFARLIIALAPPHLVRGDVMAFMDAQTDDMQNKVDYREFVISGKVMIVQKKQTTNQSGQINLPIKGWLSRQATFVGDSSTYTWKNHVKWYQTRLSTSVVWLMRRAARAIKHAVTLELAYAYLRNHARQAIALAYLLEVGAKVANVKDNRLDAKRNLLVRSLHARKTVEARRIAYEYLSAMGKGVVKLVNNVASSSTAKELAKEEFLAIYLAPKKRAPDIGNVYKVKHQREMAIRFLRDRVARAQRHCSIQDVARKLSTSQAEKAKVRDYFSLMKIFPIIFI
jgi:hypothetical protein